MDWRSFGDLRIKSEFIIINNKDKRNILNIKFDFLENFIFIK